VLTAEIAEVRESNVVRKTKMVPLNEFYLERTYGRVEAMQQAMREA
jgi:hypothetical protein